MRRIIFSCFLGITILLALFYRPILTQLASLSLQAYSFSQWGHVLQYETLSLNGTRLTVTRPHFDHAFTFQAEQAVLDFNFDWKHRMLHINIDVFEPQLTFHRPFSFDQGGFEKTGLPEERWFKIRSHLHLVAGHLTWSPIDASERHHIRFDLDADGQQGALIKIFFDPQNDSSNLVALKAESSPNGMELQCKCQEADCPSLSALAAFFGFSFPEWHVASGALQGELKATFPGSARPYLEGELLIKQLALMQAAIPLQCHLELAKLTFEKNHSDDVLTRHASTINGELEILKPAYLNCQTPHDQWSMSGIKGSIGINGLETALIHLEAQAEKPSQPSRWILEGMAALNDKQALSLDLTLHCASLDHPDGKMRLTLFRPEDNLNRAQMSLQSLPYTELDFMQKLLSTYWPRVGELKLNQGIFDALLEADVTSQGIGEVRVKQFLARRLSSRIVPLNAVCNFDLVKIVGKAQLNRDDFWSSVQAALHLENGSLNFEGIGPVTSKLPLTDIQGHLLIQDGQVENSLVTLQLAGLKGKMDVEWGDHKQLLTFKLDGTVQDLAELFPSVLQEGMKQHFYRDRLMILANAKNLNQQIELGGTLHIEDAFGERMDTIHFGCELNKQSDSKYSPSGWFYASKLPVEKYLSPFIFRDGLLHMEGDAEFKGSFDDQVVKIKYDADDLKIENENLLLEITRLHSSTPGELIGTHQFDLNTFHHCGTLPIQHASYYEKNSGLLFQDINGVAEFTSSLIRVNPLETSCEGIFFSGKLELDYSDPAPGVFNLQIHCPTLSGKVSQIQHLLAHLETSSLFHRIPLEGEMSAKQGGLRLDFTFNANDYHLNGEIQGSITDGSIPFEGADMALRGIYMDVNYHHHEKRLEFNDIQGTFLVGKPLRTEEFLFSAPHVHIHQLPDPNLDVDIAIKDHDDEIFRIVAHTKNEENGIKSLVVNPLATHISCIYPQEWNCRLLDWTRFEQFNISSQFDLNTFLVDLCRFRKTGLFFLSHCLIDKLSLLLPMQGQGSISLQASPDQSYSFHLEGQQIKQKKSQEHHGILKGSKRGRKWIIDQFQWDDCDVYAELFQAEERWKIPFLGLHLGSSVLLGLEGDFIPNEGLLHATLKFCEMDIAKLDRWDILKPFIDKWHPKGFVKAAGEMEWSCLLSNPMEGFNASLRAETHDLSFRNYPLNTQHPFDIEINGDEGFCIKNAQIEIPPFNGQSVVHLEKLDYQPIRNTLGSLRFSFEIPSREIASIGESLHYHFPDMIDDSVKELLAHVQADDSFKGRLKVENRSGGYFLQLGLDDGVYGLNKKKFAFKQLEVQIAGSQLNFSAFAQHERVPFQIVGWTNWPDCRMGQTTFIHSEENQNVLIKWEQESPEKGYAVKSIKGTFCGCQFDLMQDADPSSDSHWKALKGSLSIDFNRLCALLSEPVAEKICRLRLGSMFTLSGDFWMDPELGNTLLETVYFKGSLKSREAILKGYHVENIQGDIQYIPGRFDIQNLEIRDPAGIIKVPNATSMLDPKEQNWSLHIPGLSIRNLRISHLRDIDGTKISTRSKFRSLIVKKIDLRDFSGELNRQETWRATGNLHFTNQSRKNLFHPLFAIPGEIILRLGLDPNVLNPVTGAIFFNLQGDRFYLTKLKDVFSEGRGSKFYLAESATPSWMDFEGNLSVKIRMKQYNLIFKLAELFTVSIQGNIRKPTYSLQPQPKSSRKPPLSIGL